jgi:predicted transcriptional regulator
MHLSIRNKKRITRIDSHIFASLVKAQRPLPIKQIAKRVDITWSTAKIHVQKLVKLNVLTIEKTIRKNRVQIDPKFINYLKLNKILNEDSPLNFVAGSR